MKFLSTIFLSLVFGVGALAEFKVPTLTSPVMDQVGLLHRSQEKELVSLIYDFNRQGKAQFQVLIVPTLEGEPIEQASIRIVDQWKLGDEKSDNGALLLIAVNDRKIRIEVGQGLEGVIPDVYAHRIISDVMAPLFRAKQYGDGVVVAVHEMMRLVDPEFVQAKGISEDYDNIAKGSKKDAIFIFILIVFFLVFRLLSFFSPGGRSFGHRRGSGPWIGGGGFGGGSGGSWSGGGGGFSGGGASGDW